MNKDSIKDVFSFTNRSKEVILIFVIAFTIRLLFLIYVSPDARHSFAEYYGSTALGLYHGDGATYNESEVIELKKVRDNITGDYLNYYQSENRKNFLYTLPGPSFVLAGLWYLIPVHNFLPYLFLQILLDSIIIMLFFVVFKNRINNIVVYVSTVFLIFNPISFSKTVMVSYDFWAPFSVLINFIGIFYIIVKKRNNYILLLVGVFSAITLWFRDIINFLPFYISIALVMYYKYQLKYTFKNYIKKISFYLVPVLISISLLAAYRYNYTGSFRPTQTFFWHAFFCAIGQFDNPYGIEANDMDVWKLGEKLNSEVDFKNQFEYSKSANNIYEETLRNEAINFISDYPHLFIRNMIYRTGMMISPIFFTKSSSAVADIFGNIFFKVFGIVFLILWSLGFLYLFKRKSLILYILIPIFLYFFSIFSWYYLIGRVILCFAVLNIILYVYGILYIYEYYNSKKILKS